MAVHDLTCSGCGAFHRDIPIPITVGARAYCAATACPLCHGQLFPVPAIGRISLFSDGDGRGGSSDFTKFTTEIEDPGAPGGYRHATIASLADIRRLEKESEQRERNGEGRRYVWRSYSQDRSNEDQHAFMADPSMKPAKHYTNDTPVTVRRGDPVTTDHGTVED